MKSEINIAVIDLYNNEKNEGMRCIREISEGMNSSFSNININYSVADTRYKNEIPSMDNNIFISSGGPGSPFEGEGSRWEKDYFNLLSSIWDHNQSNPYDKKYIFFICHSFQLMARFFKFASVTERGKKSFGVIPFSKTAEAEKDEMFRSLPNPFYAADFRQYQVIDPDKKVFDELGAVILSREIADYTGTSAVMAVRISDEIAGTQFHPEADPESMIFHLNQHERIEYIIDNYGEEKYHDMLSNLQNDQGIKLTRQTILPAFLSGAITNILKF